MTDSEKPSPAASDVVGDENSAAAVSVEVPPEKPKSVSWLPLAASLTVIAVVLAGAATYDQWKSLVPPLKVPPLVAEGAKPSPVPAAPTLPAAPSLSAAASAPASHSAAKPVDDLAALRERVAQLEARPAGPDVTRLDRAEAAIQALQAQPKIPESVAAHLSELDKQVADLRRTSADAAAVLRLADRVEKAEADLRELQARRSSAVAVLLAVGQLRDALARAMPFDAELRALLALAGTDPEVVTLTAPLKARAAIGIPSAPVLVTRFARLAPDLARAQVLPTDQGWWRQTLDRLASLVVIRREDGEAAGDGAAAIVARVEARLAQDDLEHAVAEAATFKDVAADIAAPWLADAQARLAADRAASALTAHVVAQVGARP